MGMQPMWLKSPKSHCTSLKLGFLKRLRNKTCKGITFVLYVCSIFI